MYFHFLTRSIVQAANNYHAIYLVPGGTELALTLSNSTATTRAAATSGWLCSTAVFIWYHSYTQHMPPLVQQTRYPIPYMLPVPVARVWCSNVSPDIPTKAGNPSQKAGTRHPARARRKHARVRPRRSRGRRARLESSGPRGGSHREETRRKAQEHVGEKLRSAHS